MSQINATATRYSCELAFSVYTKVLSTVHLQAEKVQISYPQLLMKNLRTQDSQVKVESGIVLSGPKATNEQDVKMLKRRETN